MADSERLHEVSKASFPQIGIYRKADGTRLSGCTNPYFSGIINGKEKMSDGCLKTIPEKLHINVKWTAAGAGA